MGGEMADAVLPHSPAAAGPLLYVGSPREAVPCTEREQACSGFEKEGYLGWKTWLPAEEWESLHISLGRGRNLNLHRHLGFGNGRTLPPKAARSGG